MDHPTIPIPPPPHSSNASTSTGTIQQQQMNPITPSAPQPTAAADTKNTNGSGPTYPASIDTNPEWTKSQSERLSALGGILFSDDNDDDEEGFDLCVVDICCDKDDDDDGNPGVATTCTWKNCTRAGEVDRTLLREEDAVLPRVRIMYVGLVRFGLVRFSPVQFQFPSD